MVKVLSELVLCTAFRYQSYNTKNTLELHVKYFILLP
jgi:hypothetical protein